MRYPKWVLGLVPLLVVVHLNFWMWNDTRLFWGFPSNLLYHFIFSFALSIVMMLLVRYGWPGYLDEE